MVLSGIGEGEGYRGHNLPLYLSKSMLVKITDYSVCNGMDLSSKLVLRVNDRTIFLLGLLP